MKKTRGQYSIEIIIGFGILSVFISSITLMVLNSYKSGLSTANYLESLSIVREGIEAVKSVRDNLATNLTNGAHGLAQVGGKWVFSGTSDIVGKYTRTVTITDVQRDSAGAYVTSGGTSDPRSKKAVVKVTWTDEDGVAREVSLEIPITQDWRTFDWRQTTDTHFGGGTHSNTQTSGAGETANVRLAQAGGTAWSEDGNRKSHDTDPHFNGGTHTNTQVSGTGTNAVVVLTQAQSWAKYPFVLTASDFFCLTTGWAFGQGGFIYQRSGAQWSKVTSPVTKGLHGCSEFSSTLAFAAGDSGTIIQWNGSAWSEVGAAVTPRVKQRLNAVDIVSASLAHAVGAYGKILQWDGSAWAHLASPVNSDLLSVDLISATDGWAVGKTGTILRWNGAVWSKVSSPTGLDLNDVFMVTAGDGWAVGGSGVIIRWNGTSWSSVSSPVGANLNAVFMVSASDGWAVGSGGIIIRWNGTSWASVTSPTASNLRSVYMQSATEGWIGSDDGTALSWNGTSWSAYSASAPTGNIRAVDRVP